MKSFYAWPMASRWVVVDLGHRKKESVGFSGTTVGDSLGMRPGFVLGEFVLGSFSTRRVRQKSRGALYVNVSHEMGSSLNVSPTVMSPVCLSVIFLCYRITCL